MKKFPITLIALFFAFNSIAQTTFEGVEKKITKINNLYPSFENELRVSPQTTWGYRAGLNIFLEYGSSYSFYDFYYGTSPNRTKYFEFIPTMEIYYRWYYRLLKRQKKGKKTINNSAAYFFTGAEIMTPGIKIQSVNNSGLNDVISGIYAGWGFRRTIGEKIIIDLNLRYAILMENVEKVDFTTIILGFKIGYRLH
ncbi:hypothetical protein [Mariniphaga sediminis]|uniref:hypothetical protein n=1 Tax=Mariniphaga sediminis TaxID=1628158 RepID=UPI0035669477